MTSKIIDYFVSPIKVIDLSHLNLIEIEKYCLMKKPKTISYNIKSRWFSFKRR